MTSPPRLSYKYIRSPPHHPPTIAPSPLLSLYAKSNPKPFIQLLYLLTKSPHAAWGSLAVENSMHSSRAAFSSLQTQQGLGFAALAAASAGLLEAARLLIWRESEAGRGGGVSLGGRLEGLIRRWDGNGIWDGDGLGRTVCCRGGHCECGGFRCCMYRRVESPGAIDR